MTKTATPDLALKLRWYGDKKKWPKGLEDLPALLLEASAALASPPPAVEPVAVPSLVDALSGTIEALEATYPSVYWTIGRGKVSPDEPLYGAIIETPEGTQMGCGESDDTLLDALNIAIANAGLELAASPPPAVEPVAVKPLEWRHDGHGSYCYCPVTDTRWTARNQHERDRSDERRAARIRSALDTPSTDLREENERLEAERAEQWRLRREMEASRDMERALAATLSAENAALTERLDGCWLPIEKADREITHQQTFPEIGLTLRNSDRYWVRDADGRVFEASWTEDGKGRDYWWDWEGESPVDPVEFMPHPLSALARGI